ncbi:PA0069 family radical SAM protein [Legionella longbeachae]|uniref:Radical SAM core domain-containing protein n=1 Tax=Legionella longbeachae serogroup 1 (strain NSW150) TaxID=661367 RepID=D3HR51_LEGLN|nr:PA0069 family radical SAM protein [Legionella longbeachae]VEE01888.1 Predicted Fe-S oxidoreductase [Legionella oakridgensis]HBD7396860.1 PA0069 family radical SAM protein [Legionella pneumophila]ARB91794.1 radical SAM protein [Legionella longbeachae]QIN35127.1 PA0069 family radical SAM protein [Legionella longbeachae]RZV28058.1 PA0069 family radical SAM protein [Legionella longbeachae]
MKSNQTIKNRGALSNPDGRFEPQTRENLEDGWNIEEEILPPLETSLFAEHPKSIISRNDSPDLGFDQSINPYRGCEHGCIYCYARPSHSYMNLSPGIDFETKIFYKVDAAKILEKEINKSNYQCKPIVLGANTDPYQPVEAKLGITRSLLKVLESHNHPAIIITKNSLIERDTDILFHMAKQNLIKIAISITTLSTDLKRIMEPRTTAPAGRIKIIQHLTENQIPVRIMVAPVTPMINDTEMEKIIKTAAQAGAKYASYVLIRLPHEVKELFKEWLVKHFPQRAGHVMSLIRQMRGGKEYDAHFGTRMRGEGEYADLLKTRFQLACKRFGLNSEPELYLNTQKFCKIKNSPGIQLSLWDKEW